MFHRNNLWVTENTVIAYSFRRNVWYPYNAFRWNAQPPSIKIFTHQMFLWNKMQPLSVPAEHLMGNRKYSNCIFVPEERFVPPHNAFLRNAQPSSVLILPMKCSYGTKCSHYSCKALFQSIYFSFLGANINLKFWS
jgi:hypothetical protein